MTYHRIRKGKKNEKTGVLEKRYEKMQNDG